MRAAAKVGGKRVTEADATTHYRVVLDKLPCWAHLSDQQYQQMIRKLCYDIREQAERERAHSGKSLVGIKRLLRLSPHHRPNGVEKSPAPPIHCRDRSLRCWFIEAYKGFVQAYRAAYARLHRIATSGEFPHGGVPPTTAYGAQRG